MLLSFDHYSNADAFINLTESIENNDTKRIHRCLDTLRILYSQQEN